MVAKIIRNVVDEGFINEKQSMTSNVCLMVHYAVSSENQ